MNNAKPAQLFDMKTSICLHMEGVNQQSPVEALKSNELMIEALSHSLNEISKKYLGCTQSVTVHAELSFEKYYTKISISQTRGGESVEQSLLDRILDHPNTQI